MSRSRSTIRGSTCGHNLYVTAVAFPAVQVGAILDYRYDLRFDSIFFTEPWYFAGRLPTLLSEIVYYIPKSVSAQTWSRDPYKVGIQTERSDTVITSLTSASRCKAVRYRTA